jgi:putative transposase
VDERPTYEYRRTLDTATALGLKLCFTPVRSPESNGIADAFVKTFKRDYAQLSILSDAETVIALLPAWFEDYTCISPRAASTTPGLPSRRGAGVRRLGLPLPSTY